MKYLIALAAFTLCALASAERTEAVEKNLDVAYGPDWKQLPDWRGVWSLEEPLIFAGPEHAVIAKVSGDASTPRSSFEHGVTPGSYFTGAPYKPEYQKLYDERIAAARDKGVVEDPIENCFTPHGMPRLMGATPGPAEFLVTPKQTWIVWDYMNQTRRIYTDGRGTPSEDLHWPRTMGYSIGRWEGQTLVVDTVWTKEGIYDRTGAPHSDQLRIHERISRTAPDMMTIDMTIEDPVMFTQAWKVTRHLKKNPKKWVSVPGTYCAYDPEPPR